MLHIPNPSAIKVILFDLGGVLVELDGQPFRNEWWTTVESPTDSWKRWLTSDIAQSFERGEISPDQFARDIIADLELNVRPEQLLQHFRDWVLGFYPGALELIEPLAKKYTLGVYSNITSLHWPQLHDEMEQHGCFSHFFASYKMGMAKPDPNSFKWVAEQMSIDCSDVLFIDDNLLNVQGARAAGMIAQQISGIKALKHALENLYQTTGISLS